MEEMRKSDGNVVKGISYHWKGFLVLPENPENMENGKHGKHGKWPENTGSLTTTT